jgi:hypothetical protein
LHLFNDGGSVVFGRPQADAEELAVGRRPVVGDIDPASVTGSDGIDSVKLGLLRAVALSHRQR